jgi:hypothetical protein
MPDLARTSGVRVLGLVLLLPLVLASSVPAGLLRKNMTPKPAYRAPYHLIKEKWWTRTTSRVGRGGKARFHGFYGDYRVAVATRGGTLSGTFTFDKTTRRPIVVRLR